MPARAHRQADGRGGPNHAEASLISITVRIRPCSLAFIVDLGHPSRCFDSRRSWCLMLLSMVGWPNVRSGSGVIACRLPPTVYHVPEPIQQMGLALAKTPTASHVRLGDAVAAISRSFADLQESSRSSIVRHR